MMAPRRSKMNRAVGSDQRDLARVWQLVNASDAPISYHDRFAAFEAQALNGPRGFSLDSNASPCPSPPAWARVPGIKIHDTRMLRLMEVLLQDAGTKVLGWRTAEIHQAILSSFSLAPATHTLTQLRYDLRKMRAHELLQRAVQRYVYRLTDKGTRVAFALRALSTNASAARSPTDSSPRTPNPYPVFPKSKLPTTKADRSIEQVIQLLAA